MIGSVARMIAETAAAIFWSWQTVSTEAEVEANHGRVCVITEASGTRNGVPVSDSDLICFVYPSEGPPLSQPPGAGPGVCVFEGCARPWPPGGANGYLFAYSQPCDLKVEAGEPFWDQGVLKISLYSYPHTALCRP